MMKNRVSSITCNAFALAVVFSLSSSANAVPFVKFEDSLNTSTTPTSAVQQPDVNTFTERESVKTFTESVNTFTESKNTQGSKELTMPTPPTTEEPPCRKKARELKEMLDMYAKLGIEIADVTEPDCDSEGFYKPTQCLFFGCHCVDRYGNVVSEVTPFKSEEDCVRASLADVSSQ